MNKRMKHLSTSLWLAVFLSAATSLGARAGSVYENYAFTTFAGMAAGSRDGSNSVALFNSPRGVTVDGAGNVYVADTENQTLRKILPAGRVTTMAGLAGSAGYADGTGGETQFNNPRQAVADSAGNLYVVDSNNQVIRKITPAGVVTTLAGGVGVSGTNDGPGTEARFNYPQGLAVDSSGMVYVADTSNHTIRKITPAGVVTTLAGTAGVLGTNNGTGTAAKFYYPYGLAVGTSGTLYVADCYNHVIRKITAAGVVTTFSGRMSTSGSANGTSTSARFSFPVAVAAGSGGILYVADYGNSVIRKLTSTGAASNLAGKAGSTGSANGTSTTARFNLPFDVAVDLNSGFVYVADSGNQLIRKITSTGVVSTLAGQVAAAGSVNGTGSAARFYYPSGAAVDGSGNVYIADYSNQLIRKITPAGVVTTLAGSAGVTGTNNGTGTAARFYGPAGVAVDAGGVVYVADYQNHAIRKITAAGVVTTLAGRPGTSGTNDGTGTAARFSYPIGVAVDTGGNVYVGDSGNNAIRKITSAGVVTTLAGLVGTSGTNDGVGSAARFYYPEDVAVDGSNYVYVADGGNSCIRKVAPDGTVTTLAGLAGVKGSDDGTNSAARFSSPLGLAADSASNLYVGDSGNHVIRKITPDGVVTTIGGVAGATGTTDGTGSEARFNSPEGLAVDANGFVYVTDADNHTIRKGNLALSDRPIVDMANAVIGTLRHLDVTNTTTTSWTWSIDRYPAPGTAQLSATTVRNPTFNPDVANDFYVIRFQGLDAQGRMAIGTLAVGDDMRPQVVIADPTWDQQIHDATYTVTGTATDDFQVVSVEVQVNDGPWVSTTGLTNWTSQVALSQGVNTIRAYAVDNRGQFSATNSVSVALTPGPPSLTVTQSGSSVIVSWPYPSTGFVLQQNSGLNATNWAASSFTITTNAVSNSVTIPASAGNLFLRLQQ